MIMLADVAERCRPRRSGRTRMLAFGIVAAAFATVPTPASAERDRALQDAAGLAADMERAFSSVTDYQCRVSAQIVNGRARTAIRGSFYFRRPRQVLLKMGVKGGVVFKKDGRIRGWFLTKLLAHDHQPGDAILRDARGRRIDEYVMGDLIAELKTLLDSGATATVGGGSHRGTAVLSLDVLPGDAGASFSSRTYWIDRAALLPLGFATFDEGAKVEEVWCEGLKVNTGLQDDFF